MGRATRCSVIIDFTSVEGKQRDILFSQETQNTKLDNAAIKRVSARHRSWVNFKLMVLKKLAQIKFIKLIFRAIIMCNSVEQKRKMNKNKA